MADTLFFPRPPIAGTHRPAAELAGPARTLQAGSSSLTAKSPGAPVQPSTRTYHAIVADASVSYGERFLELIERREELAGREDRTPTVAAELLQLDDLILPKLVLEWRLRQRRSAKGAL